MSFFSQTVYSKIETSFYEPIYGNYKFDTDLTTFGISKERKFRKVNRSGSILKLKELNNINSIYPMMDEFGYTFADFFIFKSTWDLSYHFETSLAEITFTPKTNIGDPYSTDKNLIEFENQSIVIGRTPLDIDTKTQFE